MPADTHVAPCKGLRRGWGLHLLRSGCIWGAGLHCTHIRSAGLVWRAGLGFLLLGTAWQQRAHVRFSMGAPVQAGAGGRACSPGWEGPGRCQPVLCFFPRRRRP